MKLPITVATLPLLFAISAVGCLTVQPQPAPPPTSVSSYGPFGSFSFSSGAACSGHTTLINGRASIKDPCFTGAYNIVLCTDTTSASAVQCSPSNGYLTVSGTTGDTIAYARVH